MIGFDKLGIDEKGRTCIQRALTTKDVKASVALSDQILKWTKALEISNNEKEREALSANIATIVWNNISNVKQRYAYGYLGKEIDIEGSIAWQYRDTTRYISLEADSKEMATRLTNAMNFLREQCDTKKSQYGF